MPGTLRAAGHDVVWAGEWEASPSDDDIIARAAADERILVTLDKDFGELAVVRRLPHAGIIRLVACRTLAQGTKIAEVLDDFSADLLQGAIVTVEPGRVRVRPPDTR